MEPTLPSLDDLKRFQVALERAYKRFEFQYLYDAGLMRIEIVWPASIYRPDGWITGSEQ